MKRFTTIVSVLIGLMIVVATRLQNDHATRELQSRFTDLQQTALVGQMGELALGQPSPGTAIDASAVKIFYSLDAKKNDVELIRLIDEASTSIYFAVYSFTKQNIADALVRAKQRGVVVEGITDTDQLAQDSQAAVAAKLRAAGIPYGVQKRSHGLMHIKALVTEKAYAIGSYNWTDAGTRYNDEILEIGTNQAIRMQYEDIVRAVIIKNK